VTVGVTVGVGVLARSVNVFVGVSVGGCAKRMPHEDASNAEAKDKQRKIFMQSPLPSFFREV
jgi:hypothetical protein